MTGTTEEQLLRRTPTVSAYLFKLLTDISVVKGASFWVI